MRKEEEIKLNLESLCVYKGIFKEKALDKFKRLVDKLCSDNSLGECIEAYNDFTYDLLKKDINLSFKELIVDELLLNVNPFNSAIEHEDKVPTYLVDGIKAELNYLNIIASINSDMIKTLLLDKYGAKDSTEARIKSLISWGVEDIEYEIKENTEVEIIKKEFINSTDWTSCNDKLIEFHQENGTGRCAAYRAFVWERYDNQDEGSLREVVEPDPVRLSDLVGYELQKEEIISNTKHFLNGLPANNLLLYGSRGTGKSSTVKAILNEYHSEGLRLIEVDKEQLRDFTRIIRLLKDKKQKFIIFVDDLVFDDNEDSYSALKTILEGRIENRPSNILIYATTNRRHLIQEKFSDRDDVNSKDTMEEKLSLADRFGITISFFTPNQKEFLQIVDGIVETRGIEIDKDTLHREALKWEKWHNGRSPRSATQFIDWLEGELSLKRE
ncbi:ATP-binding protein [Clostridium paraputrificum]|uniref:ATP-binding protein n=1 Tax=Clostridium TaxID=1485 RepID=UPI003D32691D